MNPAIGRSPAWSYPDTVPGPRLYVPPDPPPPPTAADAFARAAITIHASLRCGAAPAVTLRLDGSPLDLLHSVTLNKRPFDRWSAYVVHFIRTAHGELLAEEGNRELVRGSFQRSAEVAFDVAVPQDIRLFRCVACGRILPEDNNVNAAMSLRSVDADEHTFDVFYSNDCGNTWLPSLCDCGRRQRPVPEDRYRYEVRRFVFPKDATRVSFKPDRLPSVEFDAGWNCPGTALRPAP